MKLVTFCCFALAPCATRGIPTLTYDCCQLCKLTAPTLVANFCLAAVTLASHLSAACAASWPGAVWTAMAPVCMRSLAADRLVSHLAVACAAVERTGITSPLLGAVRQERGCAETQAQYAPSTSRHPPTKQEYGIKPRWQMETLKQFYSHPRGIPPSLLGNRSQHSISPLLIIGTTARYHLLSIVFDCRFGT